MDPVQHLREFGWCVVHGLVPADRLVEARRARPWGRSATAERVMDAWSYDAAVRDIALDQGVRNVLTCAFGRRPIPFQTLNFSVGTEQSLHADSIHFDSIPAGRVAAAWVALEDVGRDQGPVVVVPSSHLLPPIGPDEALDGDGQFDYARYEAVVAERVSGMDVVHVEVAAGDVLFWHGNLVHGGSQVRLGDSSRLSQVTHYFFEGCVYVTPMWSDPSSGRYKVRQPLIDIGTRLPVRHSLDGRPVRFVHQMDGRTRVLSPGDPNAGFRERSVSAAIGLSRRVRHHGVLARRSVTASWLVSKSRG